MKDLQDGIVCEDSRGAQVYRRGFHQGYFPVSCLVSTFPSASDVAWTEIFGDRPLPGYQRTYFSHHANTSIFVNGVSSSMEFERQMTWRMESGFAHAMSYLFPERVFKCEVAGLIAHFLATSNVVDNYYGYILSTDCAQHMACNIFDLLSILDNELQQLRAVYREREGRELEILILSDHGNNQGGQGKRVMIRSFLKAAGYRIRGSISGSKDIVLPTVGIESWVEIHNLPSETQNLLQLLPSLPGVDILTAQDPGATNRFIVMNPRRERGIIEWNRAKNSFRYTAEIGDPIGYLPVTEALRLCGRLDRDCFATADDWMEKTMAHRYPLALERIARAHSIVTLNPATILISLQNDYVHATYMIKKGSELVRCGGTHGGLDQLDSNGILLSSFAPTPHTSANRVATLFDGFQGLRDYRAEEEGAEWVTAEAQSLTRIARAPLDGTCGLFPAHEAFLRIWTPRFANLRLEAPVEAAIRTVPTFPAARVRRGDPDAVTASERRLVLDRPLPIPGGRSFERVYSLPDTLKLEPHAVYVMSGRIRGGLDPVFQLTFHTDGRGQPVAY